MFDVIRTEMSRLPAGPHLTVWSQRDEPVLRWLVENPRRSSILRGASIGTVQDDLGLTRTKIDLAIETLHDAGLIFSDVAHRGVPGVTLSDFQATGKGHGGA